MSSTYLGEAAGTSNLRSDEDHKLTYPVRGHAADLLDSDNDEEDEKPSE